MEVSDGTCEGTADTTMLVQIEEAKCAIRKLPFVTVLASYKRPKGATKGQTWEVGMRTGSRALFIEG